MTTQFELTPEQDLQLSDFALRSGVTKTDLVQTALFHKLNEWSEHSALDRDLGRLDDSFRNDRDRSARFIAQLVQIYDGLSLMAHNDSLRSLLKQTSWINDLPEYQWRLQLIDELARVTLAFAARKRKLIADKLHELGIML